MKKDVKEGLKNAVTQAAEEIYEDGAKSAVKEIGGCFGTLAGFFNKVVLYPLKRLNIEYEQKAIAFEREMQEKYNTIPEDNRCEPKLNIVGPALESLKYNILEDDLREMFKNLLVNNMDNRKQKNYNSAFVKIIEQMSSNDAAVLKWLTLDSVFLTKGRRIIQYFADPVMRKASLPPLPKQIVDFEVNDLDRIELSASLSNLERLGLLVFDIFPLKDPQKGAEQYEKCIEHSRTYMMPVDGIITMNDFGKNFVSVCL